MHVNHFVSVELKKAFRSKLFISLFITAVVLAVISAAHSIYIDMRMRANMDRFWLQPNGLYEEDPVFAISTIYNSWMGGEVGYWSTILFFYLLPLFSALSFGASIHSEITSGYIKSIMPKCGRGQYYASKYIVGFLCAGFTVVIPLLINLLIVACFIPARTPDPILAEYYAITESYMWSNIYYTNPLAYTALYLVVDFIYAGLFCWLSLTLSLFIRKVLVVLFAPFFVMLILQYVLLLLSAYRFYIDLSPFSFLRAAFSTNITNGYVILIEAMLLFLFSLFGVLYKVKKDVF